MSRPSTLRCSACGSFAPASLEDHSSVDCRKCGTQKVHAATGARTKAKSKSTPETAVHGVLVSGDALRSYNTRTSAMEAAERAVYLPSHLRDAAIKQLERGESVSWSYGYSSVTVYPWVL